MTRFGTLVCRIDERGRGVNLPLMSVSQTLGVVRRSALTDDPPRADSLDDYKVCRAGDIVFNKMSIRDGAMGVAREDGLVTYHYEVMRPRPGADPRYVVYLMKSEWFTGELIQRERGIGAGGTSGVRTTEVPFGVLRTIDAPIPESTAQRAIADYLDVETARIDRMIALRTEQARLMRTRLDGLVRRSVSVDRDGSPYPRTPLRRRWAVVDCKHRTPEYVDEGIPVVSPGDATPGRLDLSVCTRFVTREDFEDLAEGDRRPRRGDIVYSRNASIGIASYVGGDDEFTMGQDVCVIRSSTQDQRFLTYVLNTLGMDQLEEQKLGSTFSRINVSQILGLSIPCPPAERQSAIADALDSASERNSQAVDIIALATGLLVERRRAVISAAVTGQLTIPGVAA